jgi:stress-induced morphogen
MGRLWRSGWGIGNGKARWLVVRMQPNVPDRASSDRADRMTAILSVAFPAELLRIVDDSAHHAGHVGVRGGARQGDGGQTHYSVLLVSGAFRGMNRVARSRAVHTALAGEFGPVEAGGMHALALTLRTPEEHAAIVGRGG